MEASWSGPLKPNLFNDLLRPAGGDADLQPEWLNSFTAFNTKYQKEGQLNRQFVEYFTALKEEHPGIFNTLKMVLCADLVDKAVTSLFRIDALVYEETIETGADTDKKTKVQYRNAELALEFKLEAYQDPFDDNKEEEQESGKEQGGGEEEKEEDESQEKRRRKPLRPFLKPSDPAVETRSQLASYAALIDNYQYRKHIFQLLICGNRARFIRWDHSGAVVSESFDYTKRSDFLVTFLYRFSRLNEAERGRDTRFMKVSSGSEDDKLAREKLQGDLEHPGEKREVFRFSVTDDDGKIHELLAWKHAVARLLPVGRATRAFPVWNKTMGAKMFYKDGWHAETLRQESEIVRKLHSEGVPNIPTIIAGGTLSDLSTFNDEFAQASWNQANSTSMVRRVYRFVLIQEVGRPLCAFTSTRELLKVTHDAFIAHREAYLRCGYLHRDISEGNILIVDAEEGTKGLLIDWELSKHINEINDGGKQPWRTGTWQFMSTRLNNHTNKRHQLQDDLESFLHVVMYTAFRYLDTDTEPVILRKFIDKVYNSRFNLKQLFFEDSEDVFEKEVVFKDSPTITSWVLEACSFASEWLRCPASKFRSSGRDTGFKNPDAASNVPDNIRFHNHDALNDLWTSHLQEAMISQDKNIIPFDYLNDTPLPGNPTLGRLTRSRTGRRPQKSDLDGGQENDEGRLGSEDDEDDGDYVPSGSKRPANSRWASSSGSNKAARRKVSQQATSGRK
ncbi:hypothetical protein C8J56DRAFT_826732 [Mycena floridula]|nr:hypothetical protein C8J56DRAFT_826732 [Mycena floridula]